MNKLQPFYQGAHPLSIEVTYLKDVYEGDYSKKTKSESTQQWFFGLSMGENLKENYRSVGAAIFNYGKLTKRKRKQKKSST